jgi:hypothetical protein
LDCGRRFINIFGDPRLQSFHQFGQRRNAGDEG